jgi:hypothetical protein
MTNTAGNTQALFDPDALIAAAERETGLSDWGGDEFREPLNRIAVAAAEESRLTEAGAQRLTDRVRTHLRNRLRLIGDRNQRPRIADQQIVRPIFITGLPRAGTTHTHALLSQDPGSRSPRLWEILDPSPPASCDELDAGPRLDKVQASLETTGFSSPAMKRIHQTDASTAEEDGFIFEYSFASRNFPAFWRMPGFVKWLDELDHQPVYAFHKKFLQQAQSGCAGDRWVLKAPMHMYFMDALLAVYPDAIIIQNHRDPARVIPSISNFFVKLRGLFSDDVDPQEIGEYHLNAWLDALEKMSRARKRPEFKDRVYDIHYLDIANRPLETIEDFYDHFGLPLSDEARHRMESYVAARAREGHGADYALEDYGLQSERIDELYASYMQAHGVEKERRK